MGGIFMLETNAIFTRKEPELETTNCIIEKVIRLSGAEFDRFSKNLLRDWDFIRDNPIARSYDEEGRCHCLLVVGEGRRDGILVNPEGSSYARYSAFMPNAEAFLNVGQYSALAALNKKLTAIVDFIATVGGAGDPAGRGVVNLQDEGFTFGIDFMTNNTLRSTMLDMLNERPGIRDWELDGGQLIVYREMGGNAVLAAEDISDPSVTSADMYAYGYTWDGMIPLGNERALELFDARHEIFRLYENDAEGLITAREEIQDHDGLFGTEDPAWEKSERTQPLQAFVMNSEKYSNGEAVGEWLTLPADSDTLQGLLERIGVEKPSEVDFSAGVQSAFTVTALRMPIEDDLREYISTHDSLDELNMLASIIDDMEDYELDKLQAILSTNMADLSGGDIKAIINLLCEENFTAFDFIYADNEDALGRWYADMEDEIPEGVSFAEHGRHCVKAEDGKFVPDLDGYIKRIHKNVVLAYDGVVSDEHKIVEAALRGMYPNKPERGSEQGSSEKPSVMDEIKASRQKPRESKARAASKAKDWDVQKTKKNKGGHDL